MNRKTMIPLDPSAIKALMKERGYTYKDIEDITNGEITEISLKHFLNKGGKADKSTLDTLAGVLGCSQNVLVDKGFLSSINLSFEVNKIIADLYLQNKEDVNCYYADEIKKFRNSRDLKLMLEEAHRLFFTLSQVDFTFDKTAFVKAYNLIGKDFAVDNCIASQDFTRIQGSEAGELYSMITETSGEYNPQQVILMFLYVFILFDAIFMEEAVASATQLVPERKTEKADQYLQLTWKSEKMRNTLIEWILYKRGRFTESRITETDIEDTVIEGISLMLVACEKCYQHLHGNFVNSEYLNRAAFSGVLTKLEKIFEDLEIQLPEGNAFSEYANMNTTRFGCHYNILKNVFKSLNPPRKPIDKYQQGFNNGVSSCFGFLMMNQKSN